MLSFSRLYIRGDWEARGETPQALADRFLRMIDAFAEIDPALSRWDCDYRRPETLDSLRGRFAEHVAANQEGDFMGTIYPDLGYRIGAFTRDEPPGRSFSISVHAGATTKKNPFCNQVTMGSFGKDALDWRVVNHRIMRGVLLAIADAWDPAHVAAYSDELFVRGPTKARLREAWIEYLSPRYAEKIDPPAAALVERLPSGGLLMSATTEIFDIDNPQHRAAAAAIAHATKRLNLLPNLIERLRRRAVAEDGDWARDEHDEDGA
jgi:hypothetical protein